MSSEDEEEYIVSAILDHKLFKDLVEESLKSKCKFSPGSIEEDRHRHSKYGYLVHWENYSMKERTWEPESNLKKLLKLQEYKEKIGLPDNHEKYDYHYGANVWRQLGLAAERVDGFRYLMSAKEKAEAKAEKYRKLQALNATAKAKREKENTRQRMVTPEDPESGVKERKKQKKLEQMGVESFDFRIPRKSTSDTSQTQVECEVVRPSISLSELNLKIPRIPKKVSASVSTPQASHATLDTPNPNPFYDPCELRQVYASSSSESMSTLPTRLKDFTQPLKPEDFKVKKRPRVLIPAKEQEEMQRKLRIKDIRKNLISIREQLKKYPVEISATRATRSFSTALQLVKLRRCQSSERLNERWMTNAEMEILGNNFERMEILERKKPKKFTKVWTAEAPTPIIDVPRECFVVSSLFHKNWKQVESVITRINIKLHANFLKLLELLIRAFSEDDAMQFEQIFCEQFPDNSKFDGFKYMAIVLISTQCRHKLWPNDKEGKSLVESTCTVDEIRRQEVTCSESHRKCLWMEVFLKLLPDKMRFLETSGKGLNGDVEEADGPFRDDIFFHCMRHGAECQKILFFKYSKPIGIQEDTIDDFSVDVMHLLAVQHGNLQRIGWYLSQGGIDINALATHLPTNNVLRLQEYLKVWSEMHVKEELHKKYYQRLVELVRFTADMLEIFVENQVMQMIGRKMAGRWKIQMDLTYPHILRCSPLSNRSNGGDGTHQVLSCLFYPQSIGLRDGLPPRDENDVFEADRVERLRMSLRKYQKLVMDRKGRLVLAVLRIDIGFCAQVAKNQPYSLPTFKLIESDEGFEIEKMTILRQTEGLAATEADLAMVELKMLASPGCRYYGLSEPAHEHQLVVPGNAHIELTGTIKESMSFAVQVFFIKKNV
uniref:Chromo domain-containing protein n=1 Tax=Caenorhabditis japonica TaxID=281687 RepID=A0A8R1DFE5_CAEJA